MDEESEKKLYNSMCEYIDKYLGSSKEGLGDRQIKRNDAEHFSFMASYINTKNLSKRTDDLVEATSKLKNTTYLLLGVSILLLIATIIQILDC